MNAPFRITTFKTTDGVALPLPAEPGVTEGTQLDVARTHSGFEAHTVEDLAERKRRWQAMLDALATLPPLPGEKRRPPLPPLRRSL